MGTELKRKYKKVNRKYIYILFVRVGGALSLGGRGTGRE